MAYVIEPYEPRALIDADWTGLLQVRHASDAATDPSDVPVSLEGFRKELSHHADFQRFAHWLLRDGDRIVAYAAIEWDTLPTNTNAVEGHIAIDPTATDERRAALSLARAIGNGSRSIGRTLVWQSTFTETPTHDVFDELCGAAATVDRESRLKLSELDKPLMSQWIEGHRERAGNYVMHTFVGPTPEELIDAAVTCREAMNTAPMDDLEFEPEAVSADGVRAYDVGEVKRGRTYLTSLVTDENGEGAGFTRLIYVATDPWLLYQEDTSTVPAHRNKGIGRWLKATAILEAADRWPEAQFVRTFNAESNDPMLAINVAMGFRPHRYCSTWNGSAERLAAVSLDTPGTGAEPGL